MAHFLRNFRVRGEKRPALLVTEMQNDFLEKWDLVSRQRLIGSINELANFMRTLSLPVVWVRQEFEPDPRDAFAAMKTKGIGITIKGTSGSEFVRELAIDPSDRAVIKERFSAFFGTTLDQVLNDALAAKS